MLLLELCELRCSTGGFREPLPRREQTGIGCSENTMPRLGPPCSQRSIGETTTPAVGAVSDLDGLPEGLGPSRSHPVVLALFLSASQFASL